MKLRNITLALAVIVSAWAFADNFVTITFTNGTTTEKKVDPQTEVLTFGEAMNALIFSDGTEYSFSDIAHIGFRYEETTPTDSPDIIKVTWNGTESPTVECTASGVTAEVNGGNVTLTNTNTSTEYTYLLSGSSAAGSFTLIAEYKSTIKLNGVNLKSNLGEALNIKCGKRINLELVEGTTNSLEDCTEDNGQKGALYCKGHLEVSGTGVLNLTGNIKHALSTKEYFKMKKTAGTINVLKAAKDGIHAGQYFKMSGGEINISGVADDGIQAEITTDTTDEDNGQMIIKDGTINITVTGEDVAGLKSDSHMTVSGGAITIHSSGAASKAMKSNADMIITAGDITITNSGTGITLTNTSTSDDTETAKGISVDNNLYLTAGNANISMSGDGGKGIKVDKNIYIGDEETTTGPQLTVTTTGSTFGESTNTGGGGGGWPGGGGWGGGPGGGGPGGGWDESSGSGAKAIKCEGEYYQYGGDIYISTTKAEAEGIESKNTGTKAMNFNGGNLFMKVYDDCINSAGQINFNGANVICYSTGNDAIDSNYGRAGAITVTGGTVISFTTKGSPEMGIDADNMQYVKVTGGTLITGGGLQGGGSSASIGSGSTHYKAWSTTVSYTSGQYYSIVCGDNIITWLQPCSLSSTYNLYASDLFTGSTKHNIYKGSTMPTSCETSYDFRNSADGETKTMIWMKSNITSGTSAGSFTPN